MVKYEKKISWWFFTVKFQPRIFLFFHDKILFLKTLISFVEWWLCMCIVYCIVTQIYIMCYKEIQWKRMLPIKQIQYLIGTIYKRNKKSILRSKIVYVRYIREHGINDCQSAVVFLMKNHWCLINQYNWTYEWESNKCSNSMLMKNCNRLTNLPSYTIQRYSAGGIERERECRKIKWNAE